MHPRRSILRALGMGVLAMAIMVMAGRRSPKELHGVASLSAITADMGYIYAGRIIG